MKPSEKRAKYNSGLFDGLQVDLFAGGGGASLGWERATGRAIDIAINHDRIAVALHQANHPHTRHIHSDVMEVDPVEVCGGRRVDALWASPDCTQYSRAKGGKPIRDSKRKLRCLAHVIVKWAKRVRPAVIMMENVREFEDWGPLVPRVDKAGTIFYDEEGKPEWMPCPRRKGRTFRRWVASLRNLGYVVEWRTLNAADYGAPTHRRRWCLVARCDGLPIVWPEPSHGPGRSKPYRQAAECIDWSLPTPSIFLSSEEARPLGIRRPLKPNTMKRVAMGIKKFVLDAAKPYIVRVNHGGDEFRGQSIDQPLGTVTGHQGFGLAMPFLMAQYGEAPHQDTRGNAVDEPIRTITPRSGGGFSLAVPFVGAHYGDRPDGSAHAGTSVDKPFPTIASRATQNILTLAQLVQYNGEKGNETRGQSPGEPIKTITPDPRFALAVSNLVRIGQTGGNGSYTSPVDAPLPTVTSKQELMLATALVHMNHGDVQESSVRKPIRTIVGGGNHHALVTCPLGIGDRRTEVRAFLTKYFGTGVGQPVDSPLHTITPRDRFGLVTVDGIDREIGDIGLRMLNPRELFRCQGFPDSYKIDIPVPAEWLEESRRRRGRSKSRGKPGTARQIKPGRVKPLPKDFQTLLVGNSVPPDLAFAIARANLADQAAPVRREPKRKVVPA